MARRRRTAIMLLLATSVLSCRRRAKPAPAASVSLPNSSPRGDAGMPLLPRDGVSDRPIAVAVGDDRACFARADGRVVCFGPKTKPAMVTELSEVVQLTAHDRRWCSLHREGFVTCWKAGDKKRNVIAVTRAIELGDSCVRHEDGRVSCWSYDAGGVPTALGYVGTVGSARALAKGRSSTHCIVRSDQKISCWGENATGQIGDESTNARDVPYIVPYFDDVDEVVVDQRAGTCGRAADKLTCWGGEWITLKKRRGPDPLPKNTMQVAMSETHACARTVEGHLWCFRVGQNPLSPAVEVAGLDDVVHVAVGKGSTCALTRSAKLLCWGDINQKQAPSPVELGPILHPPPAE